MKKILLLLLTAVLSMPLVLNAQMTATFGTGTSATTTGGSAGAPMSYGGAYSWTQQIYRASELIAENVPAGAVIISIEFYNATGATLMSDLRTYMGHCTNDYFSGTSDWVPYNSLTLVDSGDWNAPDGWFTINLDAPFVWDGTSNLVVGVSFRGAHSDYSTNNPNCGYRYTAQSGSAHIRRFSTTLGSEDPTSTAAANSVSANRPNMRINYVISGCASLTPSVANIGPYTADLSWFNFQQSVSSWDILYGEQGTFDTLNGGTTVTNITDTFYNMTGLTSATTYAVYMKPYCSSETGAWSSPRIFTTTAACPTPIGLTLMSHTAEEATITWLPGANESGWEVACVPHGAPVASVPAAYVSSYPYTFTNLIDNTQYDLYVRADCGNGENSYWTSPVTFTTDPYCTPPSNVTAEQVMATSALITWSSAPVGATGYTLGYSEAGLDNWTTITSIASTSQMLSGLNPNTAYDVFVFSECVQGHVDTVYASFETGCMSGGDPFTEGTITTYLLPLNNYYNYTYTQQIYLASEMSGAATIDSLAFEYAYSTPSSVKSNVTIYLGHTAQSTFSSTSNYIPSSGLTQVYSGPLNCTQGWNTFVFTTPFQYNGTDNLVLVIDDNSGDYDGSAYVFRAHNAGATRSVYYYSDSTNPDPTNPTSDSPSSSTTTNRSNVKFFFPCDNTVTCLAPNVYVSEFSDESITIGWAPGYSETSWEVEYSTDGSTWTPEGTVTTSPYTISNLTSNTLYYIRIRSICGSDNSNWNQVSQRTACADVATLPFMENFDSHTGATTTSVSVNNLPYCWSYINEGTSTSYSGYPMIYASATYAASGSNSMRFYTYTTAGTYDDQIAILPPIDTDVNPMNTLQIALDVRDNATSYPFHLDVGIMTDPTDRNTFVTLQTITTSSTTYANYEIPFSQYQGTGKYIALRASQPTTGYNYGYVDNIRVEPIPACPKPINVTSTAVTTTSVTLNWTEVGSATSWVVTYGPTGFTPGSPAAMTETAYSLPFTVNGLSSSMGYDFYVQSECGGSDLSSMSNVYTVATQCDMITALPLMENFDAYAGATTTSVSTNNLPYCWSHINTGTSTSYSGYPIIYASATYAASGNNSMRFYTYTTSGTYSDQIAILPQIDVNTFPMNTLQISFDARDNSTSYTFNLVVGVMTDPTDASTFVPVQTITSSSTTYANYEIPFYQYTGTGAYIALKAPKPTSGYNYGYVDNIVVDIAPLCAKPTNVIASNITADGADINWMPGGNETGWEVVVVPHSMPITTGTPDPVSTHPYTLTNLNDNTSYDVYVRADCGTGTDYSSWSQVCTFSTTPLCSAPTDVTVSQVAGTSALLTWTEAIFGATGYTVAYTETGQSNWTTQSVTGNSYMLTNLTPETPYTVTITSECNEGTAPVITKNFTTGCLAGGDNLVGNGTSTTYNIPLNTFYNYSYVQQLYLANEINNSGDIHSISFQYIYATAQTKNNQSIYLAETDLTTLSTWIPADSLTLVYSGSVNYNNSGTDNWVTITLDSAFNYSGTRNLVVVVKNDHGSYTTSSNYTFKTHSASGMTLQYYNDSSPFSLTSPSSASTYSYRNNIKFGMECDNTVTCIAPNVYVVDATDNSITLNWAPGNGETSWEIETSTDNATWTPEGTATTAPYTLNNLTPSTLYYIRMRSVCGGGEYSSWTIVSERTECVSVSSVPFMENFDSYTGATTTSVSINNLPYCWSYLNDGTSSSYSGYPMIYASATYAASGINALRFYTYSTSGTYDDQIAILPALDLNTLSLNTLQVSFDARNISTYTFTLEVGIMTDPTNKATFMPISTITTTSNTYANYEIPLNQYTGTGAYIALKAPKPTSSYNAGYVDNVRVEPIPTCPKPTNVHVTNVTTNTIELGWTETGSATSWAVEYGPTGFTPGSGTVEDATTNPYTVSNLTSSTQYDFYVRAVCGIGDTSNYSTTLSTATACDAIDQLPYTEGFDTYGTGTTAYPNCWTKINTYTSGDRPYVNSTNYAGVGSLYFYASSGTYNIGIMPPFDATIPVNTLQASFMYRASSTTDYMIVGVMTNPTDASTFVPVDTVYPGSSATTWEEREVVFNGYNGTGQYIAFYNGKPSATCYSYIDNLSVDLIPSCPKPQSLHVVDATTSSVELGWTEVGSATSWEIVYGDPGFDPNGTAGTVVTATSNPFNVTGLNSSTTYQFYVRSACGGSDVSYWSNGLQASTTMTPVGLPYTADFSTNDAWVLNNGGCTNYWVKGTVGSDPALFVTDNGTTPNYTISSTSVVAAQKLFTVGTNDTITITFDVQVQGEGSFDYMKLFLAPASAQFPASTAAPSSGDYGYNSYSTNAYDFYSNGYGTQSSYHYVMNMATGTVHVVAKMPNPNANPTASSTALMVFAWKNDGSVGTQPPATITNLTVTADTSSGPVITNPTVATNAATAIAQTSATLNATITNPDNVTISAKGFEWKATQGGTYTQIAGTGANNGFTANLTGLTPSTSYTYRAFITFNGQTVTGNEQTFTTQEQGVEPCNTPTGLTVSAVTDESITVSWDADANVSSWNIQYRPVGGTLSSATSNTNSYTINGLQPETSYQIQVQANCGGGNVSEWSSAVTGTTTTGIDSWLANSVSLYPNPAKEYVDIRVDGDLNVKSMEVYDVYGKLINTVIVTENPTRINVSGLANGMYFVRVSTEAGMVTKTFVKK